MVHNKRQSRKTMRLTSFSIESFPYSFFVIFFGQVLWAHRNMKRTAQSTQRIYRRNCNSSARNFTVIDYRGPMETLIRYQRFIMRL